MNDVKRCNIFIYILFEYIIKIQCYDVIDKSRLLKCVLFDGMLTTATKVLYCTT